MSPVRRGEDGAFAIVYAVVAVALFTLAALVVDLAHARDVRRQAQEAVDAAALAAGNALHAAGVLPDTGAALAAAKSISLANFGTTEEAWASCTDPDPLPVPAAGTACVSFALASGEGTSRIRVRLPERTVPLHFAAMLGAHEVTVRAAAESALEVGGRAECGVCVLGTGLHDVQNGDLTVQGADVRLNGGLRTANNGTVTVTDGVIGVQGTATGAGYAPAPLTGQRPVLDPLAFLAMPRPADGLVNRGTADPCALGPGRYEGRSSFGTCRLAPGTYVVTGLWKLAGQDRLLGEGVTLVFTCGTSALPRECTAGEVGGGLDAAGGADLGLTAPLTGPNRGLVIAYDRDNAAPLRMTGTASSAMSGTIYARSALLNMRGNSGSQTMDSLIVVRDLTFDGNRSRLSTTYTAAANVEVPPRALHLSE